MPRDIISLITPVIIEAPATIHTSVTGTPQSTVGYDAFGFIVNVGSNGDALTTGNYFEFNMLDSPDGVNFTAVPQQYVQYGNPPYSVPVLNAQAANSPAQTLKIGYLGQQPYVRLDIQVVGTMTNGTQIGINGILASYRHGPAGQVQFP